MDQDAVLAWLKRRGTQRTIKGMARYAIVATHAVARRLARSEEAALRRVGKDALRELVRRAR